jgi:two-component system sensor histidine kinase BaeS
MTRRLAIVIVSVVVATLLLAGVGTLGLATVRARATTENDLRAQTTSLAGNIGEFLDVGVSTDTAAGQRLLRQRVRLILQLKNVLPVQDFTIIAANLKGKYDFSGLPVGLRLPQVDLDAMTAGQTVSGIQGKTAFASASGAAPNGRKFLVVATRKVDAGLGPARRLFFWAALATIVAGLGAAVLVGRRLSRPIRDAAATAHRIAAGELSARVDEPSSNHHDEVAELQRSINHMADSLERSRTLEQQFLLSVSHDLRTPLTSIRGYAEAIDDGNVDPRRAAGVIRQESQRLERLVADLLDLAKLESKAFTFHPVPMDLSGAVHTACAGASGSHGEVVVHPVTTATVMVSADPDRVAQVLANLIENACKYSRTQVFVSCRAEGGRAVVTVDDDGPGIGADDLPHVFERLYRSSRRPERKENASGLGLAIVRELVTSMGGGVAAGAAPTGGARLSFWLPLA